MKVRSLRTLEVLLIDIFPEILSEFFTKSFAYFHENYSYKSGLTEFWNIAINFLFKMQLSS